MKLYEYMKITVDFSPEYRNQYKMFIDSTLFIAIVQNHLTLSHSPTLGSNRTKYLKSKSQCYRFKEIVVAQSMFCTTL